MDFCDAPERKSTCQMRLYLAARDVLLRFLPAVHEVPAAFRDEAFRTLEWSHTF